MANTNSRYPTYKKKVTKKKKSKLQITKLVHKTALDNSSKQIR